MKAILLIGGFATRLRPLTLKRPKALIPVLNRPFLSYQLDLLKTAGVTDVSLACGRHSQPWRRAFERIAPRGMRMHFAFEPHPLGTGGAIRFAYDAFPEKIRRAGEPVLIFNGDVFLDLDIQAFVRFHAQRKAAATIALIKVEDPSRFGLVLTSSSGRVKKFLEKPKPPFATRMINAGAYVFNADAITAIPEGRPVSVERETFPSLLSDDLPLYGFAMHGYWNDIGTHASYLRAHRDLLFSNNRWTRPQFLRKRGRLQVGPTVRGKAFFGQRVSIGKDVHFEGFVSCGDRVVIEPGSRLKDCVVLDGCRIGANAQVSGSVLGFGCSVGANSIVGDGTVLADKTTLPEYTRC